MDAHDRLYQHNIAFHQFSEDCAWQICVLDQCSQTCEESEDCPAPWTAERTSAPS